MSSTNADYQIIKILTEYIPKKKVVYVETQHSLNKSYLCANPDGPVYNLDCPEDDPLCNCPCGDLRPYSSEVVSLDTLMNRLNEFKYSEWQKIIEEWESDENKEKHAIIKAVFDTRIDDAPEGPIGDTVRNEIIISELVSIFGSKNEAEEALRNAIEDSSGPSGGSGGITYDEPKDSYLDSLLQNSSECSLISEKLGDDWLGCDLEDPNSPFSCNCPCIGEKYSYYLRFNKTVSSFWDTPGYVPLISLAHKAALVSQQIAISIKGDITIRPGDLIKLDLLQPTPFEQELDKIVRKYGIYANVTAQYMKYTGYWMVSTIKHVISGNSNHKMDLILIRDGIPALEEPKG